ncbi:TolC family protein [Chitinophaga sedimenti]|nr:TolC family protein [Chitinophaga sedimenti]
MATDSLPAETPALQVQSALLSQSEAHVQLERSRLMPSFSLGYANASFSGYQTLPNGTDKLFSRSDRFQSGMIGVGIPVFQHAQRARIKASGVQVQQRQVELDALQSRLRADLLAAQQRYNYNRQLLADYNNTMLPNAAAIIVTANNRLQSGDISYLNWVLLVNQAIDIKSQFYDVVEQYNESIFDIESINGVIR